MTYKLPDPPENLIFEGVPYKISDEYPAELPWTHVQRAHVPLPMRKLVYAHVVRNFTIVNGNPGQVWYMASRWAAWLCIILTFIAGVTTGFSLLAVILSFTS